MKTKLTKGILLILSLLCILCVPVTPVYAAQQGTDGSELQVVKQNNWRSSLAHHGRV